MENKAYLYAPKGEAPIFIKEDLLTKQHIKFFLEKLVNAYHNSSQEAALIFTDALEERVTQNKHEFKFSQEPLHLPLNKEVIALAEFFNKSPLLVRDLFTRVVMEQRGIFIPKIPPID